MKQRCRNPRNPAFPNYGGRGIDYCDRWESFDNFLADMGERPSGTDLDRIDNDKGYSQENCRWATKTQQQRNTRLSAKGAVSYGGEVVSVAQLAENLGVNKSALRSRIRSGWPEHLWGIPPAPWGRSHFRYNI